ncbi:unnamed protein product [Triticum turgidum subsp. durum]|uniref:Uncharacterized protein n=1 Tax=Triticum turgidum subsp. durum TaxID=4567 RepID=A0A9R1AKJ8_TRITD|nr:unnamed protein product [Triticum turgidum subsp. durum]
MTHIQSATSRKSRALPSPAWRHLHRPHRQDEEEAEEIPLFRFVLAYLPPSGPQNLDRRDLKHTSVDRSVFPSGSRHLISHRRRRGSVESPPKDTTLLRAAAARRRDLRPLPPAIRNATNPRLKE